tara:strand:+ start:1593 stop:2186 length:594 start_codon:yes stop_codon:yes gene_type:complete
MATQTKKSAFDKLSAVNVYDKVEKKGQLTYLSWAHAWAFAKKLYPELTRKVYENEIGMNYHNDGSTAWVKVGVTIDEIEYIDYLPIMNTSGRPKSIQLENITSFEVNSSIQRSTVKALALHGLGLSVYAGEDLIETAPVIKKPKLISLEIQDDNWKKVIAWMIDNKELGMPGIIKILSQKYKIDPVVIDELSKFIKS